MVTLLALFSFISLPLLMNQGEGESRRELRRLAGMVKQLYNEATLTRDAHLLTFDLERNSMSSFRLHSREGQVEKQPLGDETSLEPLRLKQVDVVGKGSFRSGQVSVKIFPLGWMEQTRLSLEDASGAAKIVNFSPLTGATKIENERQVLR